MSNMEERLQAVVSLAETDGIKWHTIIHGDNTTSVSTENGNVPSVAKQMKEVHDEVVNGVVDYMTACETARDITLQAKADTLTIKNETETIKAQTLTLKNQTETLKNQAHSTFNSIESAVSGGVATLQSEAQTQVNVLQTAVASEVVQAETAANTAVQATNSKANLDFSNINPSQTALCSLISKIAPDWSRRQILSLNTDVSIAKLGWILMRNTDYTTTLSGYINGNVVFNQCGSYGHWQEWNSLSFLVDVGDVVKLTGGELSFFPCKGVA